VVMVVRAIVMVILRKEKGGCGCEWMWVGCGTERLVAVGRNGKRVVVEVGWGMVELGCGKRV